MKINLPTNYRINFHLKDFEIFQSKSKSRDNSHLKDFDKIQSIQSKKLISI